jgi:hypothetical protein
LYLVVVSHQGDSHALLSWYSFVSHLVTFLLPGVNHSLDRILSDLAAFITSARIALALLFQLKNATSNCATMIFTMIASANMLE